MERATALWQTFSPAERAPFQAEAKRERAELKRDNPPPPKPAQKRSKTAAAPPAPAVVPLAAPEKQEDKGEERRLDVAPEYSFLFGDLSDEAVRGGSFDCADFVGSTSTDLFCI